MLRSPYETPGFGAGTSAGPLNQMTPPNPMGAVPSKKRGFGRTLADILFGLATGAPSPMRMRELIAEKDQRETQSILQRAMAEAEAKARYPTPQAKPAVQQNYEYLLGVDPEGAKTYLQNFGAPPLQAVDITGADGSVSRSYMPRGGPAPPAAPVGRLTPIGGGASPTGSRTFPIR